MQSPAPSSSSSADPAHQPPRVSRPHRCNDRVEDVVQAFVSLRLDLFRPALSTLVDCLRSEPGSEPQVPYRVLKEGGKFLKERVIDEDGKIVDENKTNRRR